MTTTWILTAALAYLLLMFITAYAVDKAPQKLWLNRLPSSWFYALSIGVFCTTWSYYGSVGRSIATGLGFLPVYIGPILIFILAQPFLVKLLRVCKTHHITSIADFMVARYAGPPWLAAFVAAISVVGILPYISLQIKAVSATFDLITARPESSGILNDTGLYLTVSMAAFVMLFGTRRIDASEQHRGMVVTVALESVFKLLALTAVGLFTTYQLFGGLDALWSQAQEKAIASQAFAQNARQLLDLETSAVFTSDFLLMSLLSALVIFTLPRQFQVTFVENTNSDHLRTARWLVPAYLVAINLFIIPIALAGLMLDSQLNLHPDFFVLSIPLREGAHWLALLVFLGGFAAATGMIIVETIALATMVCNSLILPLMIREKELDLRSGTSLVTKVAWVRRFSILCILLLAYAYVRLIGDSYALASIGLISFVAAAQFAPAIIGGLYWKRGHSLGVLAGLIGAMIVWAYTLLLPSFAESGWISRSYIDSGLFQIDSLKPYSLFGMNQLDRISHSLFWSLVLNIGLYISLSLLLKNEGLSEKTISNFVDSTEEINTYTIPDHLNRGHLQFLLQRFIGNEASYRFMEHHAHAQGIENSPQQALDPHAIQQAERVLAGAIGHSLARVVMTVFLGERQQSVEGVMNLLSDASAQIEIQWERLRQAVDNIHQGLAMFDDQERLVVWNRRFFELFEFPSRMEEVGTHFETFVRHQYDQGDFGSFDQTLPADMETQVKNILHRIKPQLQQSANRKPDLSCEIQRRNGVFIEIQGTALAHGGFLLTYTDISAQKAAQATLRQVNEDLEARVDRRTKALKDSEQRFRDFAESSSDWLWETNASHLLTHLSERAVQSLGPDPDRLLGHPLTELATPALIATSVWQHHQEDLANRRPIHDMEYPIQTSNHPPGQDLIYVRLSGKPHWNENGEFLGYRGTGTDITHLVKAKHELIRTEKMAALGGLVAGVAHEINTPVGISITATSHLEDITHEFSKIYHSGSMKRSDLERFIGQLDESIGAISSNLTRAAALVKSFKQVAVDQTSEQRRFFNVREYLQEILDSLRPQLKHTPHCVEIDCPQELEIYSRPDALTQILTNLIMNSLLHGFRSKESTPPLIGEILIQVRQSPGHLHLNYHDNGHGMTPTEASHMFEPFYTTRRNEGGTGLGMHIVYNLIHQTLGGNISCTTSPGHGVWFAIEIPLSDNNEIHTPSPEA